MTKNNSFINMIFFASMGKILIPFESLASFRAFYFCLPLSIIYLYLHSKINDKIKFLAFSYFLLCFISVIININLLPENIDINMHPFNRLIIHNLISSFFILSAWIALNSSIEYRWSIIRSACDGFIITLLIGYLVYILVIMRILPGQIYNNMNVQSQYAYGFLRFSPGAYPNEFGVMSAYFCVLSIYFIITRCVFFNKKYLYFLFLLSFVGMFLATTRAAYISFIISIVYIFLSFKLKVKMKFITFILLIIMILIVFIPNDILQFALNSLNAGYNSAIDSTGSISERYEAWDYGWNFFKTASFPWSRI
jgi:hypothetical protein